MKKLSSNMVESITGGNNRDCMIAGGLALACAGGGLWGPAAIICAGATWAGCFH